MPKMVRYFVSTGEDATGRPFATLDDAIDALVVDLRVGAEFSVHRAERGDPLQLLVRATKLTTRPFLAPSPELPDPRR
jgi:hypothetical protein